MADAYTEEGFQPTLDDWCCMAPEFTFAKWSAERARRHRAEFAIAAANAGDYANILDFHKVWLGQAEDRYKKAEAELADVRSERNAWRIQCQSAESERGRVAAESLKTCERLGAERDAMREALKAMLDTNNDDAPYMTDPDPYPMMCNYCGRDYHKDDCPVTLARKALGE